jgi:hypothetical protein
MSGADAAFCADAGAVIAMTAANTNPVASCLIVEPRSSVKERAAVPKGSAAS